MPNSNHAEVDRDPVAVLFTDTPARRSSDLEV